MSSSSAFSSVSSAAPSPFATLTAGCSCSSSGAFTGAYPLMYFAQEFVPLDAAIVGSAVIVLAIIAVRAATIMGIRLAIFGAVLPALAILAVTLVSAVHPRLQGILITFAALSAFIVAMALMPRNSTTASGINQSPAAV